MKLTWKTEGVLHRLESSPKKSETLNSSEGGFRWFLVRLVGGRSSALQDMTLWRTFDWVMCLEVGEHVPKQHRT